MTLIFELFSKDVPMTVENFKTLCSGERGENLTYQNTTFHRIVKGFVMQGGNIVRKNGTGH